MASILAIAAVNEDTTSLVSNTRVQGLVNLGANAFTGYPLHAADLSYDATLTADGTQLGLNLAHGNAWTALQTYGAGATTTWLQATSVAPAAPSQGAYIAWNQSAGTGETDFFNDNGGGPGGWLWSQWNGSAWVQAAFLSPSGGFTLPNGQGFTAASGAKLASGSGGGTWFATAAVNTADAFAAQNSLGQSVFIAGVDGTSNTQLIETSANTAQDAADLEFLPANALSAENVEYVFSLRNTSGVAGQADDFLIYCYDGTNTYEFGYFHYNAGNPYTEWTRATAFDGDVGIAGAGVVAGIELNSAVAGVKNTDNFQVGDTTTVWNSGDTSFRLKALGSGITHGYFVYRPKGYFGSADWYITGMGNVYNDNPTGLTVRGRLAVLSVAGGDDNFGAYDYNAVLADSTTTEVSGIQWRVNGGGIMAEVLYITTNATGGYVAGGTYGMYSYLASRYLYTFDPVTGDLTVPGAATLESGLSLTNIAVATNTWAYVVIGAANGYGQIQYPAVAGSNDPNTVSWARNTNNGRQFQVYDNTAGVERFSVDNLGNLNVQPGGAGGDTILQHAHPYVAAGGPYIFYVPYGVSRVFIEAWGGGGGGAGGTPSSSAYSGGGGGGGGGYAAGFYQVSPGEALSVTVGGGGTGGGASGNGGNGAASTVTGTGVSVTAGGGGFGVANSTTGAGGSGGATTARLGQNGNPGGDGSGTDVDGYHDGGGGGQAGGDGGLGGNGSALGNAATGGGGPGGGGGGGSSTVSTATVGAAGAAGEVNIYW